MKKRTSDSIFHNEIPMERFRRVCGLFDSIPPSERSSAEVAVEFERLRKQIEGMIEPETRMFTQDDAPDFVHNLNLLFTRVASIPILRAFMNGNREDFREAVGEDAYLRYLSSDGYRGATDPLLSAADRDAYARGDALYVLNETRRQQLSQNHTETVRASLVDTLRAGWLCVCLPLLAIALLCLGLKAVSDEYWEALNIPPPAAGGEAAGPVNPDVDADPVSDAQVAPEKASTLVPGAGPVAAPPGAAPAAVEVPKGAERTAVPERTGGTKDSKTGAAAQPWWRRVGATLVGGKISGHSNAKPLMQAIYAITILSLAGMAGATGAYLSMLMRILGVAESSQLGRNIVQFQNSRTALKLGPLLGAIFATVLSGLFAARVVTLDIFPQLDKAGHIPWFYVFYYHTDFAKWMVWAFIAGFSERLVPDMLDRLTASAQGSGAKAQPVVTSTTATLKIDGTGDGKLPPPAAPLNVQLVRQPGGKVKATWDAVPGADKYLPSKEHDGTDIDFIALPEVTMGTETVIENLPATGKLKFQVKARNSAGDGPASTAEINLA